MSDEKTVSASKLSVLPAAEAKRTARSARTATARRDSGTISARHGIQEPAQWHIRGMAVVDIGM